MGPEPNSPACSCCAPRAAPPGRMRHRGGETLHRHLHEQPFAAIVLAGGYVEAGDTGRHCVSAGDVLVHGAFERHLDRFDPRGAEVLVLPLKGRWRGPVRGRVADPDAIARLAESDLIAAQELLDRDIVVRASSGIDWPDLLAADLLAAPDLPLAKWAKQRGLHPASLSRGFRQQFEVTPAQFRLIARTRRGIDRVIETGTTLATIAVAEGFADQAHMTRSIMRQTGRSPRALRSELGFSG
ncbi:helix-turn-helix domain-containing protein [Sphingomonas asaccharolytica]|uniref:helix-turn-helix domain-containing protein n=1 Tax=Sphingomonas asaccharolytica TaxID=40681 RepID=UPI000AC467A1|nr:AraC family transcriptional regulator [Sphingomonas asaccharolytica]